MTDADWEDHATSDRWHYVRQRLAGRVLTWCGRNAPAGRIDAIDPPATRGREDCGACVARLGSDDAGHATDYRVVHIDEAPPEIERFGIEGAGCWLLIEEKPDGTVREVFRDFGGTTPLGNLVKEIQRLDGEAAIIRDAISDFPRDVLPPCPLCGGGDVRTVLSPVLSLASWFVEHDTQAEDPDLRCHIATPDRPTRDEAIDDWRRLCLGETARTRYLEQRLAMAVLGDCAEARLR